MGSRGALSEEAEYGIRGVKRGTKRRESYSSERKSIKPVPPGCSKVPVRDVDGDSKHDHSQECKYGGKNAENGFHMPSSIMLSESATGFNRRYGHS